MISKIKNFIKNSNGPFTKEGEYIDYTELHVFQNAFLYGFGRTSAEKGWKKVKERVDGAEGEYTYYHYGYVIGNRSKVAMAGGAVGAAYIKSGIPNI